MRERRIGGKLSRLELHFKGSDVSGVESPSPSSPHITHAAAAVSSTGKSVSGDGEKKWGEREGRMGWCCRAGGASEFRTLFTKLLTCSISVGIVSM